MTSKHLIADLPLKMTLLLTELSALLGVDSAVLQLVVVVVKVLEAQLMTMRLLKLLQQNIVLEAALAAVLVVGGLP